MHTRSSAVTSTISAAVETTESKSASPERDSFHTTRLRMQRNHRRVLQFTEEEENFLKEGLKKYGTGQWTAILRDPDFKFQDGRVGDSLKKESRTEVPFPRQTVLILQTKYK